MHRYLITGASGFVAAHFLRFLDSLDEPCEVLGLDVQSSPGGGYRFSYSVRVVDLLDARALEGLLLEFRPTRILHLASMSNVGQSWKAPVESFTNNTNIFLNLLDPIRKHGLETKVLSVGSSEEYGLVQESDLPLTESKPLRPGSPYGVARVAQEQLSQVFAEGYGLDVVMTRSFNHIGPGQREQFVIPSFVKQVVEAKRAGKTRIILRAGNTRVVRDFLDVRDVVRAYHELLARGTKGQVYNICSGVGRSLDQVLEILSELTGVVVELEVDPGLVRPNELMTMIGSAHKLHQELGWTPRHEFRASLNDMIDYWNLRLQEIGERLP